MKILWAKTDFLHPTNRGGQIRTLEMLRRIHRKHEVHYVAYDDPATPEGRERASEYSRKSFPVDRPIPARGSPGFFSQLAANLVSPLPLAVGRYGSAVMRGRIASLIAEHNYDILVADFLAITPNFPDLAQCVLFQHNVESSIWKRHAEHASSLPKRIYFASQSRRMEQYERRVCQSVRQIISVSPADTALMTDLFSATRIADVPTGVDLDYFRRPDPAPPPTEDLVFVGAMDWLPNIDGARWFMDEVLPLIRAQKPDASVTFAGRNPVAEIRAYATQPHVTVTGTVPDVRPYVWDAAVSLVPLRIGGGTRLKIYEAMAGGVPVVSTAVGAEGLAVIDGRDIAIANSPADFARAVLNLLTNSAERAVCQPLRSNS